jgi:3-phosphoshikimate 1-carboxyvinyltransferase
MTTTTDQTDERNTLRIQGGVPLRGAVRLGQDPHVLECALAIASLSTGRSELQGLLRCDQLTAALTAWSALGVRAGLEGETLWIEGAGLHGLKAPTGALDCARSPRLLAQLAAVIGAQAFGTRLTCSAQPPVDQLVGVLRARGVQIGATSGEGESLRPPLAVAPLLPSEQLLAIDASLPLADPCAKDALLLSGLFASGPTTLSEPQVSSDHMERLFVALGLPLRRIGSVIAFDVHAWKENGTLPGLGVQQLPGSAALAAHLAALVQWLPGSDVTLRGFSANPTRTGVLDVLRSWGGALTWLPTGDAAMREPIADVRVRSAAVRGGVTDAELLVRSADAVPALALLGPISARGVRLCELPALAAYGDATLRRLPALLEVFGIGSSRTTEELHVPSLRGAVSAASGQARSVDACDDHGLALAACTLALATPGETVVQHAARALHAIYPGFLAAVAQLGAHIDLV